MHSGLPACLTLRTSAEAEQQCRRTPGQSPLSHDQQCHAGSPQDPSERRAQPGALAMRTHHDGTRRSGLPQWLSGKESSYNPGDVGPVPGLGRSPGGGNGNPLQCSFLRNPMDGGAWRATVHGVANFGHNLVTGYTHTHMSILIYFLIKPNDDLNPLPGI